MLIYQSFAQVSWADSTWVILSRFVVWKMPVALPAAAHVNAQNDSASV